MEYNKLNLKINQEVTKVKLENGLQIEVLNYLPIRDKYDMIAFVLDKSYQDGIYNQLKLQMYFYLSLIYLYTDLTFTAEDREDEFKLYDELVNNQIIDSVVEVIDEDEFNFLFNKIEKIKEAKERYNMSAASVVKSFIEDLPRNAEIASQIVNNFSPDKFQQVVNFAAAANGNRPIPSLDKNE